MKRHGLILFLVAVMVVPIYAVAMSGCGGKEVRTQVGLTDAEKARLEQERLARERAAREAEERLRAMELARQREAAARDAFLNEHAHFDFDKYNIRPDAEVVLREKAAYLSAHPNVLVEIQGHCDERGTNAYNMALGDRRAHSSKSFLESLGVSGARLSTISYGEERPLALGHNEDAWAQNRRAQFIIISE